MFGVWKSYVPSLLILLDIAVDTNGLGRHRDATAWAPDGWECTVRIHGAGLFIAGWGLTLFPSEGNSQLEVIKRRRWK